MSASLLFAGSIVATESAATPAQAAVAGSVSKGVILAPGSPIKQVSLDAGGRSQLISTTLGGAYYQPTQTTGAINTGVYVAAKGVASFSTYSPTSTQAFGGAGTPDDPFWISTTQETVTGPPAVVTKKDFYTPGASYVRSDITMTLKPGQPRTDIQFASWVDCYLGGSDFGKSSHNDAMASCIAVSGATISQIAVSPGAEFAAGHFSGTQKLAFGYSTFPATGCVSQNATFSQATCDADIDNGLTIAWKASLAGGESITRTYYSSYDKDMKFSDLQVNSSASKTSVEQGGTVDYTVSVKNAGPASTPSAAVTFPLPEGMQYVSNTGGTYDASTGGWTVGALANGESKTITITAKAVKLGSWKTQVTTATSDYMDLSACSPASLVNCGNAQTVEVTQILSVPKSTIAVNPSTVASDGVQAAIVTVTARDTFGNQMLTGGASVTLTPTSGTIGAVTDNRNGTYSAPWVSTVSGDAEVSFNINGTANNDNRGSATFLVGVPVASTSGLVVTTGNRIANNVDQHRVEVTLRDINSNLVRGVGDMIVMSVPEAQKAVFGTFVETSPGVYAAPVTTTKAGLMSISASVYGSPALIPGSGATAPYVAGPVHAKYSKLTLSEGDRIAGVENHAASIYLADVYNNPVSGVEAQLTSSATLSSATAVSDEFGNASVTVESIKAGTWTVSATAESIELTQSSDSVDFVAGPVFYGVDGTTLTATPGSVLADDEAEHKISVTVVDKFDNPINNAEVIYTIEAPAHLVGSTSARSGKNGVSDASVTSAKSGTFQVTATVNGAPVTEGSPASVTFSPGAAVAATSTLKVTTGDRVADGVDTHTATIELRDINGNPVPNDAASAVLSSVPGSVGTVTETSTPGTYTAPLTSTVATDSAVSAFVGADEFATGSPSTVTFIPGIASEITSEIAVSPALIEANGVHEATVSLKLRDAFGNALRIGGDAVVVESTIGTASAATDNGDGTYTVSLTSVNAGDAVISFRVNAAESPTSASVRMIATPTAPILKPTNGKVVSGTAQPGNTVTVYNSDNENIGSAVVNSDGTFSVTTTKPVSHGAVLTADSTDVHGFVSPRAPVTVDSKAPDAPKVRPSNGTVVRGTAEAHTLVTIYDEDGAVLATVRVDGEGNFSVPFNPTLPDKMKLELTATDDAGNESDIAPLVIDGSIVLPPVINPSRGDVIAGTGVAGNSITVTLPGGVELTTDVDPEGNWSVTPDEGYLKHDDTVTAIQTNPAGTNSEPASVVIDQEAPDAPRLDPTDGVVASGTAEPHSTVTIRDSDGNVLGTGPADEAGRFAIPLEPAQEEGSWITATATDAAGNESEEGTIRVGLVRVELESDTVERGSEQIARGYNFQPGEVVTGTLHSTPFPLGTQVADADGSVTFRFAVPALIETGGHSVTLVGDISGSGSAEFQISAPVVEGELTVTGGEAFVPLGIMALLMVAGGLFLVLRRTRKNENENNTVPSV